MMIDTSVARNGYWFLFEDDANKIAAFGSSWSGSEKVFCNDEMVSEARNIIKFNSRHRFTVRDDQYEIFYIITHFLRSEVECLLIKNDRIIDRQSKAYIKNVKHWYWWVVGLFSAGLVAGFLAGYLVH